MARRQVKCIKTKYAAQPHEYITHIGGDWGYNNARMVILEAEAIMDINTHTHTYFVKDIYGDEAEVLVVRHPSGKDYLRTHRDLTKADNLSQLPLCS